jgi:hypothetical protein
MSNNTDETETETEIDDVGAHSAWDIARHESPSTAARSRALAAAIAAIPATRNRISSADRSPPSRRSDPEKAEASKAAEEAEASKEASKQTEASKAEASKAVASVPPPANVRPLEAREPRRRIRSIGIAVATSIALAAGVLVFFGRSPNAQSHGDVVAQSRVEVNVGGRARAVLEPNAHLVWSSPDEVTQSDGTVFYRVESGVTQFKVHTPVGDVAVLGTCFRVKVRGGDITIKSEEASSTMNKRDVKSGAVGALSAAIALVAVYEGKVAVSHAGQSVQLNAGEAADLRGNAGPKKDDDGSLAERAFDDAARDEDEAKLDPALRANKVLVASVTDYRARLERMDVQRRALEQELADARQRLNGGNGNGADADGGAATFAKNEVAEDEWKELAKTGTIKMRVPCNWKGGWWPEKKKLDELGLSRDDGNTIQQASSRLYETSWAKIRPVCEKVGGKDLADKLGLDGCPSFVFNYMKGVDRDAAFEAMRRVSEMRAGARPMLQFDDPQLGPVERVFLVMTGEQQSFETDLAQSFGPEEAHRIVTSDALCSWSSTWNGPGPRKDSSAAKP